MKQNNLGTYFTTKSTGKNVLIFFVLYLLMQAAMMVILFPLLQTYSPDMPMDGRFFYSAADVKLYLTTLGVHGRNLYTAIGMLDMVFPVLYGLFFALLLSYLFIKARLDNTLFFKLRYVPLLAGLFDIAENIGFFIMTSGFPREYPALVTASYAATLGKWLGTPVTLLLIVILSLLIGIKKVRTAKLSFNQ